MKSTFAKIAIVLSILGLVTACEKSPKSDKEKISYAIGQQIGANIKSQNIDVDVKMLNQAIAEAMAGKESRLTKEQVTEAMQLMQKDRFEKRQKEGQANLEKSKAYLEQNKSKEGVKTTASGLQYKVIKQGSGKTPKEKDTVKVHYKGTLIDGTEFDNSYKRNEPAQFPVDGVIKGWSEALQLMKEGDQWELYVPADLAYGEMGRPNIPPNSVLVFQVELLEIVKAGK